jgi:hypothetical protein
MDGDGEVYCMVVSDGEVVGLGKFRLRCVRWVRARTFFPRAQL